MRDKMCRQAPVFTLKAMPWAACMIALLLPTALAAVTFAPRQDLHVGPFPIGIAVADIDGDGLKDVVVAVHEVDTIAVLPNRSTPGALIFDPALTFPTGQHPQGIAVADFDGDGQPDVASADSGRAGGGSLVVLRNVSSPGAPALVATLLIPVDTGHRVSAADIDGDGRPDLAVTSNSGRSVHVFLNRSTPGHIDFARVAVLPTANFPSAVALADLDGDGLADLAYTLINNGTLTIARSQSTPGSVSFGASQVLAAGTGSDGFVIGDVDGDGRADISVADVLGAELSIFFNQSSPGSLLLAPRRAFPQAGGPEYPVLADFDGDHQPDLAVPLIDTDMVSLLLNRSSSASLQLTPDAALPTLTRPFMVAAGDLDGDGKVDLAVSSLDSESVSLFRNTTQTEVVIDVKPESDRNVVNPRANGVIPVAILTTSVADGDPLSFDATQVDPQSVAFGPGEAGIAHRSGHLEDVDGDGDLDLLLHFRTGDTGITCDTTTVELAGTTFSGQAIGGTDVISTVGCR